MKNFDLALTKVAAAQVVAPPKNIKTAIANSSLVTGMMFGVGVGKKEAGLLTETDSIVIAKVAKVCRHAAKFVDVLNEKTAGVSEFAAVNAISMDLFKTGLTAKVAYANAGNLALLDKHFDASDELCDKVAEAATHLFKEADGEEGYGDATGSDSPQMGRMPDEDADLEMMLMKILNKKKDMGGVPLPTNEAQLATGGGDMGPTNENVIGDDDLAEALRMVNSSTYQTDDATDSEEPSPEETAEVLRMLQAHGMGEEGDMQGMGEMDEEGMDEENMGEEDDYPMEEEGMNEDMNAREEDMNMMQGGNMSEMKDMKKMMLMRKLRDSNKMKSMKGMNGMNGKGMNGMGEGAMMASLGHAGRQM